MVVKDKFADVDFDVRQGPRQENAPEEVQHPGHDEKQIGGARRERQQEKGAPNPKQQDPGLINNPNPAIDKRKRSGRT